MSTLQLFSMKYLRNEELLGFCQESCLRLQGLALVRDSELFKQLEALLLSYRAELDASKQISYEDLLVADNAVDEAIIALRKHLQAFLVHPNASCQEAAQAIWNKIEAYDNPTRLNFTEQYAIVARMLDSLESVDEKVASRILVQDWIVLLRERYEHFHQQLRAYDSERAKLSLGRIKEARANVEKAWMDLSHYLNALNVIQSSKALATVLAEINVRIQSVRTAIKQRKALRANAQAPDAAELDG